MTRVLIVDDDPKFRSYVAKGLAAHGIESLVAEGAGQALAELEACRGSPPDMALLDVMMPVITSYSIHYTKLYDFRRHRVLSFIGK